jgi:hypothetical protein
MVFLLVLSVISASRGHFFSFWVSGVKAVSAVLALWWVPGLCCVGVCDFPCWFVLVCGCCLALAAGFLFSFGPNFWFGTEGAWEEEAQDCTHLVADHCFLHHLGLQVLWALLGSLNGLSFVAEVPQLADGVLEDAVEQAGELHREKVVRCQEVFEEPPVSLNHIHAVPETFDGCSVSLGQQFQGSDTGAELLLEFAGSLWEAEVIFGAALDCICVKFGRAKHGSDLVLSVLFVLGHFCCCGAEHEEHEISWALLCLLGSFLLTISSSG